MIGVMVWGKTPREFLKSVQMFNGAGFSASWITLGRAIYVLPNAGALSEFRSVSVPADMIERDLPGLEGKDVVEAMVSLVSL